MLSNYIIYEYNDSSIGLLRLHSNFLNKDLLPLLTTNSELFKGSILPGVLANFLSYFLNPILINNIFIIAAFLFCFLSSFLLFNFLNRKYLVINIIFSLFYSLSPYLLYRFISATYGLYFVFVFPLLLYLLLKKTRPFFLGVFVVFVLSLNLYYGYYSLIIVGLWYLFSYELREFLVYLVKAFLLPLLFITFLFSGSILNNIPFIGNYSTVKYSERANSETVYRPIEDFYNFSYRPWYFVLPPESSVFLGDYSDKVLKFLDSTGYYLADDYAAEEMAGSYMGIHFMLGFAFVLGIIFLGIPKSFDYIQKHRDILIKLFLMFAVIVVINLPPSFVVKGFEFYTPSYLIYNIVPVFRVLVRWSVVLYLLVVLINYYLVISIFSQLKNIGSRALLVLILLITSVFFFWIELPIIEFDNPPSEIRYMRKNISEDSLVAVYPNADYYSLFWNLKSEVRLLNYLDSFDYKNGISGEEISSMVITNNYSENYDIDYVVLYLSRIENSRMSKITELVPSVTNKKELLVYMENLGNLVYSDTDVYIYKLDK